MTNLKVHPRFLPKIESGQKVMTLRRKASLIGRTSFYCEIDGVEHYVPIEITSVIKCFPEMNLKRKRREWCFISPEGEKKPVDIFYEKLGFDDEQELYEFYDLYLAPYDKAFLHLFHLASVSGGVKE